MRAGPISATVCSIAARLAPYPQRSPRARSGARDRRPARERDPEPDRRDCARRQERDRRDMREAGDLDLTSRRRSGCGAGSACAVNASTAEGTCGRVSGASPRRPPADRRAISAVASSSQLKPPSVLDAAARGRRPVSPRGTRSTGAADAPPATRQTTARRAAATAGHPASARPTPRSARAAPRSPAPPVRRVPVSSQRPPPSRSTRSRPPRDEHAGIHDDARLDVDDADREVVRGPALAVAGRRGARGSSSGRARSPAGPRPAAPASSARHSRRSPAPSSGVSGSSSVRRAYLQAARAREAHEELGLGAPVREQEAGADHQRERPAAARRASPAARAARRRATTAPTIPITSAYATAAAARACGAGARRASSRRRRGPALRPRVMPRRRRRRTGSRSRLRRAPPAPSAPRGLDVEVLARGELSEAARSNDAGNVCTRSLNRCTFALKIRRAPDDVVLDLGELALQLPVRVRRLQLG